MNVCVFVCVQESVSLCEVVLCVCVRERERDWVCVNIKMCVRVYGCKKGDSYRLINGVI